MLSIKELSVSFRGAMALNGISLDVMPGEVVALIGSNGAGKSTTLKAISRVVPAMAGDIVLEGRSIRTASPREVVQAGIVQVPEGRRVFPDLTVYENLLMGATVRPKTERAASVERIVALFPLLATYSTRLAGSLSGGEQQMLALGRALMSRPRLLMLDEPSLGLSPVMVERVAELIGKLRTEDLAVLLVEQNARLALALSDRTYVLERGSVVLSGRSADLQNDPTVKSIYLGIDPATIEAASAC
jgi:branched-chain amino acid transport system ATP-binding protein